MHKYVKISLAVVFILSMLSLNAFALDITDGEPVRLGVAFTSDTFDIPDELADFVVDIVGNALASVSSVTVVKQADLNQAGASLGITQSKFTDLQEVSQIGQAADVSLILVTKINYDFAAAAKQEAMNAASGKLGGLLGGGKKKHVQPTFDLALVDVNSQKIVFNNKADLDLFTEDMKQQLISSVASGGTPLGIGSINPGAITSLVGGLVPNISKAVAGSAKLTGTAAKEGVKGAGEAAQEYVETAEAIVEAITPSHPVVNPVSYETKSTDPAKVVTGYGFDSSTTKALIKKHKDAAKIKNNEKKLAAFSSIYDEYEGDYLAAYQAAQAAFNMKDGDAALEWCEKSLAINKQYTPARRLKVKAKKLAQ